MPVIDNVRLIEDAWVLPVLLGAFLVWVLFLWKEFTQSGKKRFILKGFISLVAVVSLALIALKPAILKQQTRGTAVLLTNNYDRTELDSVKLRNKGLSVIPYSDSTSLNNIKDSINSLIIMGDGVEPYNFWQLDQIATQYLEGKPSYGLKQITYEQTAQLGDSIIVKGNYGQASIGNRLRLEDPGGNTLDSIKIIDTEEFTFKLRSTHKVSGNLIYRLAELDSLNKKVFSEQLSVTVQPENKLSILVVNAVPLFETKYLKNFLAESGHRILIRSQLTRGKYKFENFNRGQTTIYGFTKKNLSEFDLIVMDVSSYLSLPKASKNALEDEITQNGLGLFIQPDQALINSSRFDFRLKRNNRNTISLEPWQKVNLYILPAAFENDHLLEPIVKSESLILSAYKQKGIGKVGTALWNNTYQLILDGDDEVYTYIWSKTLEALSKREQSATFWKKERQFSYVDQPLKFSLRTTFPKPVVKDDFNSIIPLKQNGLLSELWEGVYYPKQLGWNRLSLQQDSTAVFNFFIYSKADWEDVNRFKKVAANKRQFSQENALQEQALVLQPISRIWFFICFLLAMGFLWIEPRFMI